MNWLTKNRVRNTRSHFRTSSGGYFTSNAACLARNSTFAGPAPNRRKWYRKKSCSS